MTQLDNCVAGERQRSDAHNDVPLVLGGIGWRTYTRRARLGQVSAPIARRKRFLRRTPSRGGRTRGGSSARIATRANRLVAELWSRAAKSRRPRSSVMSKVSLKPQA